MMMMMMNVGLVCSLHNRENLAHDHNVSLAPMCSRTQRKEHHGLVDVVTIGNILFRIAKVSALHTLRRLKIAVVK